MERYAQTIQVQYTNIEWEYNDEHFKAWCEGKTGFSIGNGFSTNFSPSMTCSFIQPTKGKNLTFTSVDATMR